MLFVPVVDSNQNPLMPTTPNRVATWIKSGKATPFWKRGIFCVRLNVEPSARVIQPVTIGVDPGSKKEGFTIKSEGHTYLNIQTDAVTWVKDAVKTRREMRRARRFRTTPCRQPRFNLAKGGLPPSTKARWQWKLRVCTWLTKMYPVGSFVVEDIKARSTGKRRFDISFSTLEVGKRWFYSELSTIGEVRTKQGYETKELRDDLGLKKNKNKMAETFETHCVDSWVLANSWVGGHTLPDNKEMLLITPLRFHRRQLHMLQPSMGGVRKLYGGTRSLGFKRGSLVKHPKWGLSYVGGTSNDRISLHSLADGQRLCQNANPIDCKFLAFNSWRTRLLPALKDGVSAP
jgi:hypothetical protein